MTKFKYGSYEHELNEANLVGHRLTKTHTARGHQFRRIEEMTIIVEIETTGNTNFDTKLAALRTAYREDLGQGQSAGLYWDDDTPTPHVMTCTSDCINGIEVVLFDYVGKDGIELANKRTIQIVMRAEYIALDGTGDGSILIYWEEDVSIFGNGGPLNRVIEWERGAPTLQTIRAITGTGAIQKGVGITAYGPYVLPNDPLWPQYMLNKKSMVRRTSGQHQRRGGLTSNGAVNYKTEWRYVFDAPIALDPLTVPRTR